MSLPAGEAELNFKLFERLLHIKTCLFSATQPAYHPLGMNLAVEALHREVAETHRNPTSSSFNGISAQIRCIRLHDEWLSFSLYMLRQVGYIPIGRPRTGAFAVGIFFGSSKHACD